MAIKLADTLAPMGDFPAAMAANIGVTVGSEEKILQDMIDDGDIGGGIPETDDINTYLSENLYTGLLIYTGSTVTFTHYTIESQPGTPVTESVTLNEKDLIYISKCYKKTVIGPNTLCYDMFVIKNSEAGSIITSASLYDSGTFIDAEKMYGLFNAGKSFFYVKNNDYFPANGFLTIYLAEKYQMSMYSSVNYRVRLEFISDSGTRYSRCIQSDDSEIAAWIQHSGQPDWNQTDDTAFDYIKNKPNIVTGVKGVEEIAFRTGLVNLTKANLGLGNVENTSDMAKTVGTAIKALRVRTSTPDSYVDGDIWIE